MPAGEQLTGVDKAAVFLVSLGVEAAAEVLKHMSGDEIRAVSHAISRIRNVPAQQVDGIHEDFQQKLVTPAGIAVDGKEYARELVDSALGEQGTDILAELDDVAFAGPQLKRTLEGIPKDNLSKLLASEHPQVAALIVAHMPPAQAGEVLARLPEEMQSDVIRRLAHLNAVPNKVLAELGEAVRDQIKDVARPGGGSPLGGAKVVAELMNHADKAVEARVFADLEQQDAELAVKIRTLMFTFEDCINLDNRSFQALLKDVAREDLLLALKTASPGLTDKVFANISSRAAEILKEDLGSSGPVRLKDVEAAQVKIVTTLKQLEAEGKVTITGAGGEVFV